ncbi:MAG: putative baseplate assembly protein [Cyanobacteria bacterium J06639_14]
MDDEKTPNLDALKILSELPKPNLDDRTYKDFVEETLLRIPRYCPEWTNYNPSDPGITLIELFAWLTDQMMWRFNQVPWRQYISYLELLGIRLAPPQPAQAEISFYLSRAQTLENRIPPIALGTEVSTERTNNQGAIIFSTDTILEIGTPFIRNFLIASQISSSFSPEDDLGALQDGFNQWTPADNRGCHWSGGEQFIFQQTPQVQNGFYLVLGSDTLADGQPQALDGHVIVLDIEGQLAGPTGINPKRPPRRWEAWDGEAWQPVLLSEDDDETFGFSFDEMEQSAQRGARRADVTLHLPLKWPEVTFHSRTGAPYTGFWLRCFYDHHNDPHLPGYTPEKPTQTGYRRSPKFKSLAVRAVGGTVPATQCTLVEDELLGKSTGKPGQQFSLQVDAILDRQPGEHLQVIVPGEDVPQAWTEVADFADSSRDDWHYTLDSKTGVIQLGPLVREPSHLKTDTQLRRKIQHSRDEVVNGIDENDRLQQQYGKVPPKGAVLRMTAYRTGGGEAGNVQPGALRIPKSAVPYVKQVTNHQAASGGTNAETLEQAVMRVPRLLRTRDRAVTPEDFETLAKQASSKICRTRCLPLSTVSPGRVTVLLVPKLPTAASQHERFGLSRELREAVEAFLQQRSLLGIVTQAKAPEYVRVKVHAEVSLEATYKHHERVREEIAQTCRQHLYEFLNPVTGGWSGHGWGFGTSLHESDITGYLHKQQVAGIRAISNVQLFSWDRQRDRWVSRGEEIVLTPLQLLDSWESHSDATAGHLIELK